MVGKQDRESFNEARVKLLGNWMLKKPTKTSYMNTTFLLWYFYVSAPLFLIVFLMLRNRGNYYKARWRESYWRNMGCDVTEKHTHFLIGKN